MTATCAHCGKGFAARQRNARFCSGPCRAAASRRRQAGLEETFATAGALLPARPGKVRQDLGDYLESCAMDGHPLASAVHALAERIDSGTDPLSGLATALRQLQATLGAMKAETSDSANGIDVMRTLRLISRVDADLGAQVRDLVRPRMADLFEAGRDQYRLTDNRTGATHD